MATGEAAEGGEGENVLAKVKAGQAEGGFPAIGDLQDGMDVTADIKKRGIGISRLMNDEDVSDAEGVALMEGGREDADLLVMIPGDEGEGDGDFPDEGEKSGEQLIGET